jgi:SAM-dependent methyltransferase
MPDLDWNISLWDQNYDWGMEGEEWSSGWGGSEAHWFGAIYPRIHRFLPANRILEIAPGYGRWTRYLLEVCESYTGIDLSGQTVEACNKRFGHMAHAQFIKNDGLSLADAPDDSYDFIFSFDSMVHAEMEVLSRYIPQMVKKLSGSGAAFIHHSNFNEIPQGTENPHSRASSVSARKFAEVVDKSGGKVLFQEVINWGSPHLIDCLTIFGRAEAYGHWQTVNLVNNHWVEEMNLIREFQSPYSSIPGPVGGWGAIRCRTWSMPSIFAQRASRRIRYFIDKK